MANLYLSHRPRNFGQVIGNSETVQSVKSMLENLDTCPRVFMFHGGTGCGKTTIARIMKTVLEISDNDFTEIDAAKDNGIEMVRKIIDSTRYSPVDGKYRMFLLDEAHRFSGAAGNALLKICEDTPKHIFIVFCTTEPTKMISALRGRCQQFQMNPLSAKECSLLINRVAKKEKEKVSEEVVKQIVESSECHPRNALQILQQVLNVPEEKRLVTAKKAIDEKNESIELCRELLGRRDPQKIRTILKSLKSQKVDAESIRRHILGYADAVYLNSGKETALSVIECFIEPTYNSGFPQITLSAMQCCIEE